MGFDACHFRPTVVYSPVLLTSFIFKTCRDKSREKSAKKVAIKSAKKVGKKIAKKSREKAWKKSRKKREKCCKKSHEKSCEKKREKSREIKNKSRKQPRNDKKKVGLTHVTSEPPYSTAGHVIITGSKIRTQCVLASSTFTAAPKFKFIVFIIFIIFRLSRMNLFISWTKLLAEKMNPNFSHIWAYFKYPYLGTLKTRFRCRRDFVPPRGFGPPGRDP